MQEEQPPKAAQTLRRRLVPCLRCGVPLDPGGRFCSNCGASVASALAPDPQDSAMIPLAGTERRQITLVFCDVVDSTGLGERLDPEDLTAIIGRFHQTVRAAMAEYGGYVARHMGDGTLTYFGYPNSHEDDAERALRAALRTLELIGRLRAGDEVLRAHIGVASGLVVVGDIVGMGRPVDIDVAGATANLAARLQGLALPGEVIACDTTRRLAGDLFDWNDLGMRDYKGISRPVHTWRVLGERSVGSRFDATHQGTLSPLLGREEESSRLEAAWEEVLEGRGQVVFIEGDAGMGKSRLAAHFLNRHKFETLTPVRFASSSHRQHSPLHPWVQQLEQLAGFDHSDDAAQKLRKLELVLHGAPERELQLMAELLLIPVAGRFPVLQLGPQRRAELQMKALVGVLERMSQQAPTVVLFEDAHWSDLPSQEMLARLATRCARMRLLLLVTTRPGFSPDWLAQVHVTRIAPGVLSAGESAQLIQWIAREHPLQPATINDIFVRSSGIPLYLEELTQFVVESGLRQDLGGTVPSSLQASLQARLDRLGGAREIVEAAACIGREFPPRLLSLVTGWPLPELLPVLDRLVDESLILSRWGQDRDGQTLTFRHVLLRDVAYGGMVRERRRGLHARVAQALESDFPARVADQPDLMAYHCAEGGMLAKSVEHWLHAGVQAMRRSSMTQALIYLGRGLESVQWLPEGAARLKLELQLVIAKGQAQIATQGYAVQSTRETFQQALRLCGALGDPPQLLSVLHGLWTHALMTADMIDAREQAQALLERGRSGNDPVWLLMGHRFCGVTHHPMGLFPEAVALLQQGVELYDPAQRATYASVTVDDPQVVMLTYLSWSLMCMGRLGQARACSARALETARDLHQAYSLSHALIGATFVGLTIESPTLGLTRVNEVLPLLEEHGIAYYGAVGLLFKGWCLAAVGEHVQAQALLESGMKAYRATGSRLYLSGFLRMTAESLARDPASDPGAVWACLEEAQAVGQATHQHWDVAEVHRLRAQFLLARGEVDAARAHLQQACAEARRQDAGLWLLRASCDLAHLMAQEGERAGALDLLAPVCSRFDDEPPLPDVERVRSLLASLR